MDQSIVNTSSPTLEGELSTIFKQYAASTLGQNTQNVTPVLVDPAAPAAAPNAAPNADPTAPVVAPTVTTSPAPAPTTPVVDADAPIADWDAPSTPEPVAPASAQAPTTPSPSPQPTSFAQLAKALGKEKIESEQEVVSVIEDIKKKAEMLSTLPADLAKAVEIARNNGNYLEYLKVSSVDWTKEDPTILYENYVVNQFTSPQGEVDYDRVERFLEKLDDDEKELRGKELQNQYVSIQRQQQAIYEAQAQSTRNEFERTLKQTIDALDKVSDFKVSPIHKQELYEYIAKGEDLKESDISSRVMNAFIKKYFQKIDSFRKTQLRNSVKKEIIESITVPQLSTPGQVAITDASARKFSLDDYVKDLQIARR